MQLEAILNLDEFHLPAQNTGSETFTMFAERKIESYIRQIAISPGDLLTGFGSQLIDLHEYQQSVEQLGRGLISVMKKARSINPHEAYPAFAEIMKKAGIFLTGHKGAIFIMKPRVAYYRAKPSTASTTLYPKSYFFHVRPKVAVTRFAPAGVPALYLANSVIGGYIETRASQLDSFQWIRFHSRMPLSFLDLDYNKPDPLLRATDLDEYEQQLQIKGLIYPLLLCCTALKEGLTLPPKNISFLKCC